MTEGKQITPLSKYEQETVILYNQAEQTADVYTHDPKLLEKLKRLTEKYPKQVQQKEEHCFVVPKRCVSIREPYSEERRQAASRRAKEADTFRPGGTPDVKQNREGSNHARTEAYEPGTAAGNYRGD